MDVLEAWDERSVPPLRAGFALDLAADPAALVFTLVWGGSDPVYLAVAGDRGSGRLADCTVVATVAGERLADPAAGAPFLGGPATAVRLEPGLAWHQAVPLADFVDLSAAPDGPLHLHCVRALRLHPRQDEALDADPVTVEVDLVALSGRGTPPPATRNPGR